jgi:hypothetical protein
MNPRGGLDAMAKRKFPYTCRDTNPTHLAHSLVTVLTELFLFLNTVVVDRKEN